MKIFVLALTLCSTALAASVPLPVIRIGPRFSMGGSFTEAPIEGTIELPVFAPGSDFTHWSIAASSEGQVTWAPTTDDGTTRRATFTVENLDSSSGAPVRTREIFTATSSDGALLLAAVLEGDRSLHFSLRSTALQALALAGVRDDPHPIHEVYATGARAGDAPHLDAAVPAVVSQLEALIAAQGQTGLTGRGFPKPGSAVASAIDAAISTATAKAPRVHPQRSSGHLGIIELDGVGGTLAVRDPNGWPLPHIPLPAGARAVSFFFLDPPAGGTLSAQVRAGGATSASTAWGIAGAPTTPAPPAPTLQLTTHHVIACGGIPGNSIVFLSAGTELAVGFAAPEVKPQSSCVSIPRALAKAQAPLLTAIQVTPEFRFGNPGAIIFP